MPFNIISLFELAVPGISYVSCTDHFLCVYLAVTYLQFLAMVSTALQVVFLTSHWPFNQLLQKMNIFIPWTLTC